MARRTQGEERPARRRQRRERRPLTTGRKIAFTAVAFLLVVALVEVALQIAAAAVGPQTHIPEGSDLPPPDLDAFRVVALGDSWVYGAESLPEQAFMEVFRRRVEEETGATVQLYNFGQSASNSSQALVRLHDNIELVRPHLVVALTGANNMLHDTDVVAAATILGEDPRLSGISWLRWSRIYRAVRQVQAVRRAEREALLEPPTPDPAIELLYGTGGADPSGSTGLPPPPEAPLKGELSPVWEWWHTLAARDWKVGHQWVLATDPRNDTPEARGLLKAWEAYYLAQLGRWDEADAAAAEAIQLGGDPAVAWEARAVIAEARDRPLEAIKHRIRAADAFGHPWIRARARGLVLLELEAWEAAEVWLMACQAQEPQNLEVLLGLSRLPTATRAASVGEALAEGPRGRVSQLEYYRWHEVSSGMVDRMVASLGEPDPGEPAALEEGRGRAAAVQGQRDVAERWFREVLEHPEGRDVDGARARAGLIRLARDDAEMVTLLGVGPDDVWRDGLDPSVAPALVAFHQRTGDCQSAISVGQEGLALGMAPQAFEDAAGPCLSRELGWSLVEQALARGPVLDRAAMVLGTPAGERPSPVLAPDLPFWEAFRERRFEDVVAVTDGAWRGLALAHLDRFDEATATLDAAEAGSDDAAVIAYGRMLLALRRGDVTGALVQGSIAATNPEGEPWIRTVARGISLVLALKWRDAQVYLLSALRPAPGYLEALEALSLVPMPLRYPAADVALRYVPSGRVPADRWAAWYLLQGRDEEATRALMWPEGFLASDTSSRARRAIAAGDIAAAGDLVERARAAYAAAMVEAEGLEDRHLYCRAAARRARVAGAEVDDAELVVLAACRDHAEAVDAQGRIYALRGECEPVGRLSRRSLEAGADPADVSEWMEPCASAELVDQWIADETGGAPPEAREWLLHRVRPSDSDELPPEEAALAVQDLLVRQLAAMDALSRDAGARFVALTYPFPGSHHQRLRDRLVAQAPAARLPHLDLYGHFDRTYTTAEWQAMRTRQDHVDAGGYAEMGEELFRYCKRRGWLP